MCCKTENEERKQSKEIDKGLKKDKAELNKLLRILLIGPGESGKTTILKQMKILHIKGFTYEEKQEAKFKIYSNVHEGIYTLIMNMSKYNIEFEMEYCQNQAEQISGLGPTPETFSRNYGETVDMVWKDKGIRQLYQLRHKFQLIDCAKYFLDKSVKLFEPNYLPTDEDILHSRQITKGVNIIKFAIKQTGINQPFEMIDVGGQRGQRYKWVSQFEGVQAVLFIASFSDFDQTLRENPTINCFSETLKVFSSVWSNGALKNTSIIVFFNKQDILEEKIRSGKKIEKYFPEFQNFHYKNEDYDTKLSFEMNKTRNFMKFKLLHIAQQPITYKTVLSKPPTTAKRDFYYHYTIATDTANIRKVFDNCYDMLQKKNINEFEIS